MLLQEELLEELEEVFSGFNIYKITMSKIKITNARVYHVKFAVLTTW